MLTTHVTSLELSRRLKELKVPQNSHFWWTTDNLNFTDDKCTWLLEPTADSYARRTSAYLASELGEMLPDIITGEHLYSYQQARNWSDKRLPKHRLVYWFAGKIELYRVDADTEANARAKMLIYLIENHLISVEELGK